MLSIRHTIRTFPRFFGLRNFPEERLQCLYRADYLAQGIPEVYNQEYLNDPIAEENAYFRKDDFLPITEDDKDY